MIHEREIKKLKREEKIFIVFYCFGVSTMFTIVGEYYSLTKLIRLMGTHFAPGHFNKFAHQNSFFLSKFCFINLAMNMLLYHVPC
jgi:hypothetical protein